MKKKTIKDGDVTFADIVASGEDGGIYWFVVAWGIMGIGFGEFTFEEEGGKVSIQCETMDRDDIKKVMNHLIDNAILDTEDNYEQKD
jgi:hypothetical protein